MQLTVATSLHDIKSKTKEVHKQREHKSENFM